ncbi:MAG: hypothetical protein BJ554DRAFT_7787, partial [Olpidium bornovanus]
TFVTTLKACLPNVIPVILKCAPDFPDSHGEARFTPHGPRSGPARLQERKRKRAARLSLDTGGRRSLLPASQGRLEKRLVEKASESGIPGAREPPRKKRRLGICASDPQRSRHPRAVTPMVRDLAVFGVCPEGETSPDTPLFSCFALFRSLGARAEKPPPRSATGRLRRGAVAVP